MSPSAGEEKPSFASYPYGRLGSVWNLGLAALAPPGGGRQRALVTLGWSPSQADHVRAFVQPPLAPCTDNSPL